MLLMAEFMSERLAFDPRLAAKASLVEDVDHSILDSNHIIESLMPFFGERAE